MTDFTLEVEAVALIHKFEGKPTGVFKMVLPLTELLEATVQMLLTVLAPPHVDLMTDQLAVEIGFKKHEGQHSHQSHWDATLVPMV